MAGVREIKDMEVKERERATKSETGHEKKEGLTKAKVHRRRPWDTSIFSRYNISICYSVLLSRGIIQEPNLAPRKSRLCRNKTETH